MLVRLPAGVAGWFTWLVCEAWPAHAAKSVEGLMNVIKSCGLEIGMPLCVCLLLT